MPPIAGTEEGLVFLDACCLINLFASGRAEEILEDLPHSFAVARYVATEEVLEVQSEGNELSSSEESRISLHPLMADFITRGILEELDISSPEEERELVRFATELDDGEAHTCALAIVRGARVATDDRKAIRVLRSAWKSKSELLEPILRTSELLFSWAQARKTEELELLRIVRAISRRASFVPPKDDPHFELWVQLLQHE